MTRIRLIMLSLLAVFAMSAVASSVASAGTEIPEFIPAGGVTGFVCEQKPGLGNYSTQAECEKHPGKQTTGGTWHRIFHVTFTSTSGVSKFYAGSNVITCKKDKDVGGISSATTVWNVVVTFEECTATNTKTKTECEVNGGTITTNALTGKLGELEAASDPEPHGEPQAGIDFTSEETGKPFVTLTGSCLEPTETAVKGSVICEVTPQNVSQTTGEIVCAVEGSPVHQKYEEIEFISGGAITTNHLEAFGTKAAEETKDTVTFSEKIEVNFHDGKEQ
jgi:hypothetical protein